MAKNFDHLKVLNISRKQANSKLECKTSMAAFYSINFKLFSVILIENQLDSYLLHFNIKQFTGNICEEIPEEFVNIKKLMRQFV